MRFDELNESNYIMFAIKNYENPQAVTQEDFYEDMKRFKWVKRLLNKYKNTGDLNVHLVMNHFIILYNVFGDATTPLLFYKLDKDLWSILKTFVIYLERLPEFPISALHDIHVDVYHKNCHDSLWEFWRNQVPLIENPKQLLELNPYIGTLPPGFEGK